MFYDPSLLVQSYVMLCSSCMQKKKEIETLKILLKRKGKKDQTNAVFIKRQKNNPGYLPIDH